MTSVLILSDQKEGNKKPGGRGTLVEGLVKQWMEFRSLESQSSGQARDKKERDKSNSLGLRIKTLKFCALLFF